MRAALLLLLAAAKTRERDATGPAVHTSPSRDAREPTRRVTRTPAGAVTSQHASASSLTCFRCPATMPRRRAAGNGQKRARALAPCLPVSLPPVRAAQRRQSRRQWQWLFTSWTPEPLGNRFVQRIVHQVAVAAAVQVRAHCLPETSPRLGTPGDSRKRMGGLVAAAAVSVCGQPEGGWGWW